jgi:predicted small metal-binding protein
LLDSPAGHSGNEAPAELDPSRLWLGLPVGHSAKLAPKPCRDNVAMAYLINCDCGYVSRGETEDELVEETIRHIEEVHPDMAGKVSRDDLLAMAEEI